MNKKFVVFIDWYGTLNTDLFWVDLLDRPEMKTAQQRLLGAEKISLTIGCAANILRKKLIA